MRVARGRVGHGVLGDRAGARIEFADGTVAVARVPDVAVLVGGHAVGLGLCWQRVFPHVTGLRIDSPDEVAPLSSPPDGPIRCLHWVAGPLAECGHFPFPERDRDLT